MLRMIMLAVVLEPIRWLARWIIGQSGEMYRRSAVCAGLAQATCDCTSPFVAVLQYYSRLLRGHGARLELVWRSASCSSYAEWCRSCQDQVQLLRRVILNASGWVYRRHIKELSKFPWKWASLGNVANVDDAVADQVIEDFMSRRGCCYRPGFARRLRNSGGGGERLTPSHGTHSKPRRPAEHAHSSNLVGSGYLLCLNYTARKSSRSSCAGEGVVIDQALPGDFEIRLMVILSN